MEKVILIDDDKNILTTLGIALESLSLEVFKASTGEEALKIARQKSPQFALVDLKLSGMDGIEVTKGLLKINPSTLIVVITAYAAIDTAVQSIKAGAYDYLAKPFTPAQIAHLIAKLRKVLALQTEVASLKDKLKDVRSFEDFKTKSPRMIKILESAEKAAASSASILITGETGTGKDAIAKMVYNWSPRKKEPFVTLNCATLSEELLASELFGHVKGAFTGAISDKTGKVELADKGTLFIDEIGELPLSLQSSLLRFLQFHEFERVGDPQPKKAAVQTEAGRFYQDKIYKQFLKIRDDCVKLAELNQNIMYQASANARRLASKSALSTLLVGITVMLFGLAFSLLILRIVVRPVKTLTNAAIKVSEGELDVAIPDAGRDEIGVLALEFNKMVKRVKEFQDMNVSQIVSEKKKSEAIVRSITDGVIVCDSQMLITAINPVAENILGVRESDAINKPFLEVTRQETLFEYLREAITTRNTPAISEDIITLDVDSNEKYYRFAVTPIRGEKSPLPPFAKVGESEFYGIVVLLQDITKLKELDRMKSEFIMMASHELRTPLTSIAMGVDLLLEETAGDINEKQKTLLQAAHEELHRLKSLVNDLLELSRIEQGRIEMEFVDVEIQALCTKAFNIIKPQAEDQKISFSLETQIP